MDTPALTPTQTLATSAARTGPGTYEPLAAYKATLENMGAPLLGAGGEQRTDFTSANVSACTLSLFPAPPPQLALPLPRTLASLLPAIRGILSTRLPGWAHVFPDFMCYPIPVRGWHAGAALSWSSPATSTLLLTPPPTTALPSTPQRRANSAPSVLCAALLCAPGLPPLHHSRTRRQEPGATLSTSSSPTAAGSCVFKKARLQVAV